VSRGRHHRSSRWHGKAAVAAAVVLLAAGGFLVARAVLDKVQLPPAAAQVIPTTVSPTPPPRAPASRAVALARSAPDRIEIPVLGVDAPVEPLGLNSDGTMAVPPLGNHNLASWYDGSVTPGQQGTAVILGHVDSYQGPSVFYRLKNLVRGDLVEVVLEDGRTARFDTDGVQVIAKDSFQPSRVFASAGAPELRLVTCGGPFDAATGHYLDSIIAYAHLVP
jgi:sortase (surface protein transpeptidase)